MADGKVIIETGLDNSGLEKDLSSSKKAVEASAKQTEKAIGESAKRTAKEVEQSARQSSGNSSRSTRQSQEEQRKEYRKTGEQSKQSAKQTEKHWTGAAGRIKSLISAAAKTSVVAVAAGAGAAIKSGISFESAFTGVKKTVDATSGELAQLKTDIRGMAKEMPESVEGIAGVAEAAGQLGIKTKSITGFTKTMVMLGDATNLSSEEAATSLARFANVTGMSQKNFDKLGSSVVALGNNMATTEKEIVEMATRISGAGSQVGLSEAQIMSYSAALSSVGIEAEAGGTAFSTLLSKMNLATEKGGDSLNRFASVAGMSAEQFKQAFKEDASGAVLSFIKGLDGINKNGGSAIKTLDDMGLSDVRIRDALLRAAGASDTFTEALDIGTKAWDKNTALTKEAETRYQTMESQLAMMKNRLKDVGISIYSSLEKPMVKGVAAANKALGNLSKKLEKGGIKEIVPEEAVNTVENLGKIAGAAAKGGVKVLGAATKVLGDNMGTAIPLATGFFGAVAGYKVFLKAAAGVKALASAYKMLRAMELVGAANRVAANGGLTLLQTTVGVLTGKVKLATVATRGLSVATKALGGPVGIATIAVGALVAGIAAYALTQKRTVTESEKFAESCEKLSKKQDDAAKSIRNLKKENAENIESTKAQGVQADRLNSQLAELMKVENKSAGTKARIKNVVAQLNKILPELNLKYDEEKDKLNQSTSAIKKNIEALKEQAMAKAYQKEMEKSAEKVSEAEIANEEAVKKQTEAYEKLEKAQKKFDQLKNEKGLGSGSKELAKAGQDVDKYAKALKEADAAVSKSEKNLNAANQELQTYSDKFTAQENYTTYLKELDALAKEAGIKASKIPESVGNGIKQGVYANPTSGKELKQLIKLDEIVNSEELAKMQQQGMKIPQYLTQGIADGSVSFKTAAQKLKNGIDWTGMIEKAKEKGKEVPNSVAEGIRSGQYAVPTSVAEVENLANFDRLKAKAQQGGIQIPEYLANGITSGSMKPAQAAKALGNLMSFQDAIDKAGLQGAKIPTELATKVVQGKTSVKDAITQLMSSQGLSEENFGLKTVLDNTAKSTGEATEKIQKNLKIKSVDNSGVVSASLKPAVTESSKASTNVKKNTSAIQKSAKIKATDNTGSGTKSGSSYVKGLESNAGKAKTAATKISSSAVSGFSSGSGKTKAAGVKISGFFVTGLSSGSGKAKAAGGKVAKAGASGANKEKSGFTTVGKNLSSGIASGITENSGVVSEAARQVIQDAKKAANQEADSHSPSRVFRDEVGKFLPLGVAVGIRRHTGEVEDASREMSQASVRATAQALDIHSPSGVYRDAIGKNIPAGIAKGINIARNEAVNAMKSVMNSVLKTAQNAEKTGTYSDVGQKYMSGLTNALNVSKELSTENIQGAIDSYTNKYTSAYQKSETAKQKYIDKLQKKYDKAKSKREKARLKKQISKQKAQLSKQKNSHKKNANNLANAMEKAMASYSEVYENQADALTQKAQQKIQDLSDEYQKSYDELIQKQDNMRQKLLDIGDLVVTKSGSLSGLSGLYETDSDRTFVDLLDNNIKRLQAYEKNMEAIKNRVPADLMEQILAMGAEEAVAYTDKLLSMEEERFSEYISKWNQEQALKKKVEDTYFNSTGLGNLQDDINIMNKYNASITALKKKLGNNKAADSLIEQILGMDIQEANTYMDQLLALNTDGWNQYISLWNQKQALASSISSNFFKSEFQALQTNYTNAIKREMNSLNQQMKKLGENIVKSFASAVTKNTKYATKAVKSLANKVVKTVKKKLGIHSPSRVFRDIAVMSFKGVEVGQKKEAPKLYKQTSDISETMAERFAKINLGNKFSRKMESTFLMNQAAFAQKGTVVVKENLSGIEKGESIDYARLSNAMTDALAKSGLKVQIGTREFGRIVRDVS